jgi:hypothetical protein
MNDDDFDVPPFPTWNWHEEWFTPLSGANPIHYSKIAEWIDSQMTKELGMKEPKGILDMAKQVKLTAGTGDNKVEVGTAQVETDPATSLTHVSFTVTDPDWVRLLGGNRFVGVMEVQKKEDTSE